MTALYSNGPNYQHLGQEPYQDPYHQPIPTALPASSPHHRPQSEGYFDGVYAGHDYTGPKAGYGANIEMQPLTSPSATYGGEAFTPGVPPPSYHHQHQQYQPPSTGKDGAPPTFEEAFRIERPRWNDVWAGVLFLVVFLGFAGLSGYSIAGYAASTFAEDSGDQPIRLDGLTVALFAFVVGVALVLGLAYFTLARIFTKQFIWITGVLNIVILLAAAAYFIYRHAWIGGIILIVAGIFSAIALFSWRKRIPFSVLMFQTAVDVAKRFGHVYIVSFTGGLITAAFGVWLAVTLLAIWVRFEPGENGTCKNGTFSGCGTGVVIGLFIYATFSAYWISEWLKNTIHTIISGVYGSWYFAPNNPANGATRGAARRALTYSFGSISLGSLVVAILDFLRFLCSVAQSSEGNSGNIAADCVFCFLGLILGCIQGFIEFINRYAFSYMALYGKSYFESAKDTWKMIKDRGIDALINECLVGPVLSLGTLFLGIVCALLSFGFLEATKPTWNEHNHYTAVIVVYSFLIGLQVSSCFTVPLSSGMDTIFVAAAWDPETLMREHAELYGQMVAVFPKVQESIHA